MQVRRFTHSQKKVRLIVGDLVVSVKFHFAIRLSLHERQGVVRDQFTQVPTGTTKGE